MAIYGLTIWMVKINDLIHRIKRKWMKLRLQPIRVYCLHHVCAEFDSETMEACDWMQIDDFKREIIAMRNAGIEFISLSAARTKIAHDIFRNRQYAVLTFDDGYASLKEILPWLEEKHLPVTLFINGKYLDGKSYRKNPKEQYLKHNELFALTSPLIEIGSHGWEHTDASQISPIEFAESIERNVSLLSTHLRYVPFHAYTWGQHTEASDKILADLKIIPVLIDGAKNYHVCLSVHRELITHHT